MIRLIRTARRRIQARINTYLKVLTVAAAYYERPGAKATQPTTENAPSFETGRTGRVA